MVNKVMTYQVNFQSNAGQLKSSLQSLQQDLKNLTSTPIRLDDGTVTKAINNIKQLEQHLKAATNVDTGKLDLTKFAQQLKQSNMDLKTYANSLNMLGTQGQTAFLKLAQSIAAGQAPLRRTNKLMAELWTTMKNTIRWQITSSSLTGFISAISTAVGYAKDLDKSLNDIRIVSGQSAASMDAFAEKANKAAKALSATTNEYAKASLIFYQQGLNSKEVEERTKATIKMANVTGESADNVSSYMTAIWNNFDNGSKSLEYYADVMTALGAATASSTDEIATGLEKFAGIAETVGLSYEYATSALATLVAETRQSPETVGTALKTIFSRLQGLKLGETLEDGTNLNKYSEALAVVGINIKEQNGTLKNMDKILDELGQKWNLISKDQQMALAQTVGGVRQYTQLITLMENYDSFKINVDLAADAEGTLEEQQKIFEDSWEASSKRVRASLEQLYSQLIDKNMFIDINNMLSGLLDSVSGVIKGFGGIGNILLPVFGMLASKLMPQLVQGSMNFVYNLKNSLGFSNAITQSMITQVEEELQKNDITANNNSNYNAIKNNTLEILRIEQERISLQGSISSEQNEILLKKKEELALENALLEKEGQREQTLNRYFNNRQAYNKKKEGKTWVSTSHEERKTMAQANRNLYNAAYFNEQLNQAGVWDGRGLGIKDIPNDQLSKSLPGTADFARDKQSQFKKIYQQQGYEFDVITGDAYSLSEEDQKLWELTKNLRSTERSDGRAKKGKGIEHAILKKQYEELSDVEKKRAKELEKQEKELKDVIDKNKELSKVIEEVEKITKKDNVTDEEKRKALEKLEVQYQETTDAIQKQAEAVKNEAEAQATEAGLDPEKEQNATINKANEDAQANPIEGDEKEALDAINQAEEDLHLRRQERTMAYQQMLSGITDTLSGLSMMVQSIQSLGSIWTNDDLSLGEKITSTVMSFSMALGAAASMAQGLQAVQNAGLILKQTSQKMDKYEIAILKIKEKLKNKELTTDEVTLKIGKIRQAQAKAEAAQAAKDTGVYATKGAAKIIGQLGHWGIPIAVGVAAAFGIGMAISAANSQKTEEKANEDFEEASKIIDTAATNKEEVKSYKELLNKYEKTGEGKEELAAQAKKLAEAYGIESAALAALTGNYDLFNKTLNDAILKENERVNQAVTLSANSLNQYIRDKDMLEKGDGGDGGDFFTGGQGKYVENYDSYVSDSISDFLKNNGLNAFSGSGNNFKISGQNQTELVWQMLQARELLLNNAEQFGGTEAGLLEELEEKLKNVEEDTLTKVQTLYKGKEQANLSSAFIKAENELKSKAGYDGTIDSIEELQQFEGIFIEQAEALGTSKKAAEDYFNSLNQFTELRDLKTTITEGYGIVDEEQIKIIEQLYNEFGATVFHPEVIPYLSEGSIDEIREALKKVGHIEIVVEDIKFREAYEKWTSGGYNNDIDAFRKDAGLTGEKEWKEFVKHTSSDKYANTKYLVDDQGQFIRDTNGNLQEAKEGQKGKTYLEGMGYDKGTNTITSAPGELPSAERYEQIETTLPQQAQQIIAAILEIDAALGTSSYSEAQLQKMEYQDLYNIYTERKKQFDEYKKGWLDFSQHSVTSKTKVSRPRRGKRPHSSNVTLEGDESGYTELMDDQYVINLLKTQYVNDEELGRIDSIKNEKEREKALVNFINSQLSDPDSKLSTFLRVANIKGQSSSYTSNSSHYSTVTKYTAPAFTTTEDKNNGLTYTENQAEAFADNVNTQNNRTVNIKLKNGKDFTISQDEYEAILSGLGKAKTLSDIYKIVGTVGMDIEGNEFLKPYLDNILNGKYNNIDFQDAYTKFIEEIKANQQKQSKIEKEKAELEPNTEAYKQKEKNLEELKKEEKLIIERLATQEKALNIEQKIVDLRENTKEYLQDLEDDNKSNDSQAYKGLAQEINKIYGTSYTGEDLESDPELLKAVKNLVYGVNSIGEYNRSMLQIYSDPNFLKKQTGLEELDDEKINLLSMLMGKIDDVDNEIKLKEVFIEMAKLLEKDFSKLFELLARLMGIEISDETLAALGKFGSLMADGKIDLDTELNGTDEEGSSILSPTDKEGYLNWLKEQGSITDDSVSYDKENNEIKIEGSNADGSITAVLEDPSNYLGYLLGDATLGKIMSFLVGGGSISDNNKLTKDNFKTSAAYIEDMSKEAMNDLADKLEDQAYELFPNATEAIDDYIEALRKGKNLMEAFNKLMEKTNYQNNYDGFMDLAEAAEKYYKIIDNINYSENTRHDAQTDLANDLTEYLELQEQINDVYGDLDRDFIEQNNQLVRQYLDDPSAENSMKMDAAIGDYIVQKVILDVEVNDAEVASQAQKITNTFETSIQNINWDLPEDELNATINDFVSSAATSLTSLGLTADQVAAIIQGVLAGVPADISTDWNFTEIYTKIENYIQNVHTNYTSSISSDPFKGQARVSVTDMKSQIHGNTSDIALDEYAHMLGYKPITDKKGNKFYYNPEKDIGSVFGVDNNAGFAYPKSQGALDAAKDKEAADNGGGGGGDAKDTTPEKKVKKFTALMEQLKEVLEQLEAEYSRLEKKSGEYLTTDEGRLAHLIGLNINLEEQLKTQGEILSTSKKELSKAQQEMLKWVKESDLTYDAEGRITNKALIEQSFDHSIADALTSDEQSALEEQKSLAIEAIENYNEIIQTMRDAEDGILDATIQINTNNLESITLPYEIIQKARERERQHIDEYLGWLDGVENQSLTRIVENADKMSNLTDQYLANETKIGILLASGLTTQAQRNALEEAINERYALRGEMLEAQKTIIEETGVILEEWSEKLDRNLDKFDRINSLLDMYSSIMEVIGKTTEEHQEMTLSVMDAQVKNSKVQLSAAKEMMDAYEQSYYYYKAQYDKAVASNDAIAIQSWKEQMEAAEDKLNEATDTFRDKWQSTLDLILKRYELAVEQTITRLEDSLSPAKTLEEKNEMYEKLFEQSDRFLTNEERIYELNKMSRQINQQISKDANILTQQKLLGVQKIINELQEDNAKLTDYQLSKLQKIYDLRLAEIALEEAQNNKTQARLVRNSQGNWNYVFTANQNQLDQAAQQLEDAKYAYYSNAKEQTNNISKEILENEKALTDALSNVKRADYKTEAEYKTALDKITKYYLDKDKYLRASLKEALNDVGMSYKDSVLGQLEGYKTLEDGHTNLVTSTQKAVEEMVKHFTNFEKEVDDTMAQADSSYKGFTSELSESLVNIDNWSETARTKISEECGLMVDALDKVIIKIQELSKSGILLDNISETNNKIKTESDKIDESLKEGIQHEGTDYTAAAIKLYETYGDTVKDAIQKVVNPLRNQKILSGKYKDEVGTAIEFSGEEFWKQVISQSSAAGTKKFNGKLTDLLHSSDGATNKAMENILEEIAFIASTSPDTDKLSGFDTGGYTGDWNSSEGRLAMLHEKEIVLNKEDTKNLLSAVEVLHGMSSSIAGMILGNAGAQMTGLSRAITTAAINSMPTLLQQEVHIDASFPGVTSAQEIENALNNIINDVAQYAEIKNL